MKLSSKQQEFLELCEKARQYTLSFNDPLIVHHYDADGCAAGAIACSAFIRKGKNFRRLCIKKLDDVVIEKLKKDNEREVIFVDLGSGNVRVNELNGNDGVVIIDHHQPLKEINVKFHVNCMLYGIDGGDELSAASSTYLVFRERVDLGIVGPVADQQSPLQGMNRYVLEEGIAKKEIKIENDLCFYGRYARPLIQFLTFSDDPYIPGISYNEDRAMQLLNNLKIELKEKTEKKNKNNRKEGNDNWKCYADLTDEEKKRLISSIADILISRGVYEKVSDLISESYVFPMHARDETYEASEFSTLLNACGRWNASDTAIALCLNEKGAIEKGRELLYMHKRNIRAGIEFALANTQDFGKFFFLDGRGLIDEGIIGIVCGMALQQKNKKPIFGVSTGENNTIKFSGRATKKQIANGINLGEILKNASLLVNGIGGGHKVAAGASIPKNKFNEFLIALGEQLQ